MTPSAWRAVDNAPAWREARPRTTAGCLPARQPEREVIIEQQSPALSDPPDQPERCGVKNDEIDVARRTGLRPSRSAAVTTDSSICTLLSLTPSVVEATDRLGDNHLAPPRIGRLIGGLGYVRFRRDSLWVVPKLLIVCAPDLIVR